AIFDADIAVLDVTGLTQPLAERGHEMSECPGRSAVEEPDHRQPRLLRARRQRPRGRRAAEQDDELAPFHHSITSSARASSVGGISSPSMRAVCALMTSSNLVDCTTGRSAGFAPLRI